MLRFCGGDEGAITVALVAALIVSVMEPVGLSGSGVVVLVIVAACLESVADTVAAPGFNFEIDDVVGVVVVAQGPL